LIRIFFSGLGKALRDQHAAGAKETTPEVWAQASAEALNILYKCMPLSFLVTFIKLIFQRHSS
jgi:hypothetical protein